MVEKSFLRNMSFKPFRYQNKKSENNIISPKPKIIEDKIHLTFIKAGG